MRTFLYLIALVFLSVGMLVYSMGLAKAGGPWHDQYCDIETTKIKVVDVDGNVLQDLVEEKVHCEDGVKDFLHGMGIADTCQMYTWKMPLGGKLVEQRDIACQKFNGEYEIVQGYHGLN